MHKARGGIPELKHDTGGRAERKTPYIVVSDGIPAGAGFLMSYLARTMQALAGMEAVRPLAPAVIVSVVFAALARWVRGVTVGGAIAGAGICCLLYLGAGLGAFLTAGVGVRPDLAQHSVWLSAKRKVGNC